MQIDELRGELTTLAGRDRARSRATSALVHRRDRRRRIVISSLAVAAGSRRRGVDDRRRPHTRRRQGPRHRARDRRRSPQPRSSHIDVVVVPASAAVQACARRVAARRSIRRLAAPPAAASGTRSSSAPARPCAARWRRPTDIAVEVASSGCRASSAALHARAGRDARRCTTSPSSLGSDVEVFMQVGASQPRRPLGSRRSSVSSTPTPGSIRSASSARRTPTRSSRRTSPTSPRSSRARSPQIFPTSFRIRVQDTGSVPPHGSTLRAPRRRRFGHHTRSPGDAGCSSRRRLCLGPRPPRTVGVHEDRGAVGQRERRAFQPM